MTWHASLLALRTHGTVLSALHVAGIYSPMARTSLLWLAQLPHGPPLRMRFLGQETWPGWKLTGMAGGEGHRQAPNQSWKAQVRQGRC